MDNTEKFINHLSCCSGYGGIGRGLKQVLPNVREIAHVEIEAYAIANLCEKMEKGLLVPAPIWSDLKTFNFSAFRESLKYGILSAGFPCQPFSIAGVSKKNSLGRNHGFLDETQGTLFFDIARIIAHKKPRAFMLGLAKNMY